MLPPADEGKAEPSDSSSLLDALRDEVRQLQRRTQALEEEIVKLRGLPPHSQSAANTNNPRTATTSPQPASICDQDPAVRSAFLQTEWLPFIKDLRSAMLLMHSRTLHCFSPEERYVSQVEVDAFVERCTELTTRWYGRPNVSAVYSWLMKAAEVCGESKYPFEAIPMKWSPDGYVRVLDGAIRKQL